jgi:hypothetical protein
MIRPEYLKTLFVPKKPGKNQPPPDWSQPFAILTAYNPGGKRHDDAINQLANRRLRTRLNQRRPRNSPLLVKVDAVSEDWSHTEKSFAVWGLNHKTASEIGRAFRQDAFFWVENGTVHVHSCHTQEKQKVGTWESRLREQPNRFAIRIYVIELKPAVLRNHAFQQQNPGCRKNPGLGCLYVGSSHDVDKRIRIHRFGPGPGDNPIVRGSTLVKRYFLKRRKSLEPSDVYETSGLATLAEALEAEYLRDKGYCVYSN